jgi:hypothetical protein
MLKPEKRRKVNFHLCPEAGTQDLLKMYKYFPNLEFEGSLGCCITKVLMDSGYIWSKKTKKGCAAGQPSRFSSRTWTCEKENFQSEESLRISWRMEGFTLPRNYWCGPKDHLRKSSADRKESHIKAQPDNFAPSGFRLSKEFLDKSQLLADRIKEYNRRNQK